MKLTTEKLVERARKIHGSKFDYSLTKYEDYRSKIIIICPTHGQFLQRPEYHLQGHDCDKCSREMRLLSRRGIEKQKFIEKCNSLYKSFYDYSEINYINLETAINVKCRTHGYFKTLPMNHKIGHGCPVCGKNKRKENTRKKMEQDFIKKANKVHKNKFSYPNFKYINNQTRIEIICKKHGKFFQRPSSHLAGSGCPKCNSSGGEERILNFLEKNKIRYETQYRFDICRNPKTNYPLPFDFYIENLNICIEYDGQHHFKESSFGFDKTKKYMSGQLQYIKFKDEIKNKYCLNNNVKLIRISYKNFDNIEKILTDELLKI